MKCPVCKNEMEKGALSNNGNLWVNDFRAALGRLSFIGGIVTFAYKCPECGKVELRTETEK